MPVWPGAVLPKAEDLVQVSSIREADAVGLPMNSRGLEEYDYKLSYF